MGQSRLGTPSTVSRSPARWVTKPRPTAIGNQPLVSGAKTSTATAAARPTSHAVPQRCARSRALTAKQMSAIVAIAGPSGTRPSTGSVAVTRPSSTAPTVTSTAASRVWAPCRWPPLSSSIDRATSLPSTGTECAIVPLWWSATGRSAAPAQTSVPASTPAGSSGNRSVPKAGRVAVAASQTAAPLVAWLIPITVGIVAPRTGDGRSARRASAQRLPNGACEVVHVRLGRVEGAHPAHLVLRPVPVVEAVPLPHPVGRLGLQLGEERVRLRRVAEGQPRHVFERRAEAGRHRVRPGGRAHPEVVLEQGQQLSAREAHLARELHAELAEVHDPVHPVGIDHDDRLRPEQAVLRAAEADDIDAGVGREGPEGQAEARRGVPDPRPVEVHRHAVLVRERGEGPDLLGG